MLRTAYISLGSNLGDRAANIGAAVVRLRSLGQVAAVSSFYETEPVEVTEQPWFLNCVVKVLTEKSPHELLKGILDIECGMGRIRDQSKGPRIIDLDILVVDDSIINDFDLKVPHPAMHQRRFVLEPLAEIAADIQHPVLKKSVSELRDALPTGQRVRRIHQP